MKQARADREEARRDTVIRIAHELFAQMSYDEVGMRDICRATGLSPTQIYRLGVDKKDLLAEVILRVNQSIITQVSHCKIGRNESVTEFVERYLLLMYELDIGIKSIRAEGAAYGWKWSHKYEALIIDQIHALIAPIVDALERDQYDEIGARSFAIWSLYYVGYRYAVMHDGSAAECLANITPSLALCLKK